jgi:hypothetical protein
MIFYVSRFILVFVTRNTRKSRTSENEPSDVPEEIINALHSFDCNSDEDLVGFE